MLNQESGCKLVGCGSAAPHLQISNDDLARIVDTSDEWISARTGIRNRRILSGNESLTSLAAQKALEMADVEPGSYLVVYINPRRFIWWCSAG
uniref:Putative thiolase-like protein n=1 Tax=Helianthus annuus TaxID=4232 RepID=A0A251SQH0_HELAN